jgi:hypothetical protein
VLILAVLLSPAYSEKLTEPFFSDSATRVWIISGLFCADSQNIRRIFNHALFVLCRQSYCARVDLPAAARSKVATRTVLQILRDVLETGPLPNSPTQYFELFHSLIERVLFFFHHVQSADLRAIHAQQTEDRSLFNC